jgi:hypothetical protein
MSDQPYIKLRLTMASDDPIEPIHEIEKLEIRPARGLREKSCHLFSRLLENSLFWKRFQFSNQINRSKLNRVDPKPDEPEEPEKSSGVDEKI